jgi:amino-acid N-acetyltransferase
MDLYLITLAANNTFMLITTEYAIQPVVPQDRDAVVSLLKAVNLPVEDLPPTLDLFLVAKKEGQVVGSVGLQLHGDYALLRSLAVHPQQQGTGMGKALYQAAVNLAVQKDIRELYLITATAAPFFKKQGFQQADRISVPVAIQRTTQFSGICPSSATVMRRSIA